MSQALMPLLGTWKRAFSVSSLCFLLASCEAGSASSDDIFRQQIVGKWAVEGLPDGNRSVMTFSSAGAFLTQATNSLRTFTYEGTWRIAGGKVSLVLTRTTEPNVQPVGTRARFTIRQMDTARMVLASSNETNVFERLTP